MALLELAYAKEHTTMPSYPAIRLAAFEPDRSKEFVRQVHGLAFPHQWREEFLDFYRLGKRDPKKIQQVPIRRLNEVIRTVAPDLLCVARGATVDNDAPWLYAYGPFPVRVMRQLIHAWIRDLHTPSVRSKHPEIMERAIALGESLDFSQLRWRRLKVNLLHGRRTAGGTMEPDARLYQLLPDALAQRIATLEPYRFEGVEMEFRIAATDRGAELVSWPPRDHQDEDGIWWKFSFVVALTVQTIPFADDFRVHLRTGVRRWRTGGPVPVPYRRAVSAYLLADEPWLHQAPGTARLAVSRLGVERSTRTSEWARGGPEGMLGRLRFSKGLPDAAIVQGDPDTWIAGKGGIRVGVVHATSMGGHGVGAGLMPRDRSPLTKWASAALAPYLTQLQDFTRSRYSVVPRNLPKEPTAKTKEERAVQKAELKRESQRELRARIARTLDCGPLVAEVRWQNPRTRDALINQLAELLGLDGDGGDGTLRRWESPELSVRLHLEDAGFVAAPLDFPDGRPQRKVLAAAIGTRRQAIASLCEQDGRSDVQIVVTEIGHPDFYRPDILDPKFAVRLGYADAGRLTKFITLPSAKRNTATAKSIAHRAEQAWSDTFRQLGVRTIPKHSLDGLPSNLQYVALWMVKRRADGPTRKRRTAPVAVKVSTVDDTIMGWDPDSGTWIPYRDLLVSLARQAEIPGEFEHHQQDEQGDTDEERQGKAVWVPDLEDQCAETAQFIRAMFYSLRDQNVLLLSHAQNSRRHWPWLANGQLRPDAFQFGSNPAQHIELYGENLCHVRVRDNAMDETPQWFAPDDDSHEHGFASGLWIHPDASADSRVYYSTAEKPHTAKNAAVSASKIATRIPKKKQKEGEEDGEIEPIIDTGQNAWNPTALEVTVLAVPGSDEGGMPTAKDPGVWAALTHQLRRAPDYNMTLALPLPLHLAKKTAQYVLPHDETDESPQAAAEGAGGETE